MKKITSKKHEIYTQVSDKISLSCFDDKRYIKDDGINTSAYDHKDIPIKYIIMTSTDIIKHVEYQQRTTVGAIKDDKLRKELQNTLKTAINIRDKKIKDFVKIYQIAVNCSYQIKYPILILYFL